MRRSRSTSDDEQLRPLDRALGAAAVAALLLAMSGLSVFLHPSALTRSALAGAVVVSVLATVGLARGHLPSRGRQWQQSAVLNFALVTASMGTAFSLAPARQMSTFLAVYLDVFVLGATLTSWRRRS